MQNNIDAERLLNLIDVVRKGVAKKVTDDNIMVYKVGDVIRIDIKEGK